MQKIVSASEAKRKFSLILRDARAGHSYVITSRGRPVARIQPVEEQSRSDAKAALLDHLASCLVRRVPIGPWTRDELYD